MLPSARWVPVSRTRQQSAKPQQKQLIPITLPLQPAIAVKEKDDYYSEARLHNSNSNSSQWHSMCQTKILYWSRRTNEPYMRPLHREFSANRIGNHSMTKQLLVHLLTQQFFDRESRNEIPVLQPLLYAPVLSAEGATDNEAYKSTYKERLCYNVLGIFLWLYNSHTSSPPSPQSEKRWWRPSILAVTPTT